MWYVTYRKHFTESPSFFRNKIDKYWTENGFGESVQSEAEIKGPDIEHPQGRAAQGKNNLGHSNKDRRTWTTPKLKKYGSDKNIEMFLPSRKSEKNSLCREISYQYQRTTSYNLQYVICICLCT